MNTQAATAKAIDWGKVSRLVLRFAWAAAVLVFKIVLIALSFVVRLITPGRDKHDDQDVGFADSFDAKHNPYTHSDNYNIARNDSSRR